MQHNCYSEEYLQFRKEYYRNNMPNNPIIAEIIHKLIQNPNIPVYDSRPKLGIAHTFVMNGGINSNPICNIGGNFR
jgi:hypothetical protein